MLRRSVGPGLEVTQPREPSTERAPRPSHEVDAEVGDDAVQPGKKTRPALERTKALEDSEESLLDNLVGIVFVVHERVRDRVRPSLMTFDERPECGGISSLRLRDERTIFLRFLRS
jgi:hypothetical protein